MATSWFILWKEKFSDMVFPATCLNYAEKFHKVSEILVEVWPLRIQTTHDFSTFNFDGVFLARNALVLCWQDGRFMVAWAPYPNVAQMYLPSCLCSFPIAAWTDKTMGKLFDIQQQNFDLKIFNLDFPGEKWPKSGRFPKKKKFSDFQILMISCTT